MSEGLEVLKEIRDELVAIRKNESHINMNLEYLFNYLSTNNKNNNKLTTQDSYLLGSDFPKAEVTVLTEADQNPWTATKGFEDPTPEFLAAKAGLEKEMWAKRKKHKRTHITDTDLTHLIERLHTEPSSRLSVEDIRLCVGNWLETGVKYSAPYYPRAMWEENKTHKVSYWQHNLDKGREAAEKIKSGPTTRNTEALDAQLAARAKRRAS